MSKITLAFIRMSFIYLLVGTGMGVLLLLWPSQIWVYVPVHAHINLLGWVSMLMFGIAYHILPRFSGRMLYSDRLAEAHLWIVNIGLIGLTFFWSMQRHRNPSMDIASLPSIMTILFAFMEAVGIFLFVFNMWMTVFTKPQGQ